MPDHIQACVPSTKRPEWRRWLATDAHVLSAAIVNRVETRRLRSDAQCSLLVWQSETPYVFIGIRVSEGTF